MEQLTWSKGCVNEKQDQTILTWFWTDIVKAVQAADLSEKLKKEKI